MRRRWLGICVAVVLLAAGCIDTGPLQERPERPSMDEIPGLGALGLDDARLTLDGTGCKELHLLIPANATRVQAWLPNGSSPHFHDGQEAKVALVVTRCRTLEVGNATFQDATMADVSVPVKTAREDPRRQDRVRWWLTDHANLTAQLAEAGIPARTADTLTVESQASYRIAEQSWIEIVSPPVDVEASVTAVTIETEVPFGTAGSIARERLVAGTNGTAWTVEQGFNVTDIGGLSGTLDLRPGSEMAKLVGNTTRSAFGFQAGYDTRMGVLEAPT